MLLETDRAKGGQPHHSTRTHGEQVEPTLQEIGITKMESARAQRIASLPRRQVDNCPKYDGNKFLAPIMIDTAPAKTDLGYLRVTRSGMVAQAFAAAVGISRGRLIRLEHRRAIATPQEIAVLAGALRISEADLRQIVKTK